MQCTKVRLVKVRIIPHGSPESERPDAPIRALSRPSRCVYTGPVFGIRPALAPAPLPMQQCDILITARWVIPVEPAGLVLEHHAVAVEDGRIVGIVPAEAAATRFAPGISIERPRHALIPGLVNAHTHAAMTLFRGLADDMPLERWLREAIWPAEQQFVGAEMVRDGTRHAIVEMLGAGITCFSDQYFFPEIVAETAADLHVRAMIGTPIVDFPTVWARDAAEYLEKGADLVHDPYADHPLIGSCFAPHATYSLSDDAFRQLRVLADQLDTTVQIHLHETAAEIAGSLERTGRRPFDRLDELGLVNASLMAVHAVHMTAAELERCASVGVAVAHCPRSNLKLASGIANVPAMRQAGITVGLGTDGAASNNVLDLLDEMRTAALLAKTIAEDAATLSAPEALRMATLDGARALGLADSVGSIEIGKSADLACIDLGHVRSQPVYDPISQVVYTCSADQVSDTWVAGRHLVEGGRCRHVDETEIVERSTEWQRRIRDVRRRDAT